MPHCLILHLNFQSHKPMSCRGTPSDPLDIALGADFSSFLAVSPTQSHFQSYESSVKLSHTLLQTQNSLAAVPYNDHQTTVRDRKPTSGTEQLKSQKNLTKQTGAAAKCVSDAHVL